MSAWRLQAASQSAQQTLADRIHAWLIANSTDYSRSVSAGQTLRWAVPYQMRDQNGNVIDPNWQVNIKDRSYNALTAPEKAAAVVLQP